MSLLIPSTLNVLGCDAQDRAIIWSTINKELYTKDINSISRNDVIQMGGKVAFYHLVAQFPPKVAPLPYIKDDIAEEARKRRITDNDIIGPGVWKNPGGKGLVIITGNDAHTFVTTDGHTHCSKIGLPIMDQTVLQFGLDWLSIPAFRASLNASNDDVVRKAWEQLSGYLSHWNFPDECDYMLMTALVIATPLQTVWGFRPQVSFTGASFSGKSRLRLLLKGMWPHAKAWDGKTSAAGIQQHLGHQAVPVLLDEMEAWHGRARVLELIRSSTSGGTIVKGNTTGTGSEYHVCHMFWLSAIEDGLRETADVNRFAKFNLKKMDRYPLPPSNELVTLGIDLLVAVMLRYEKILDLVNQICDAPAVIEGGFGRLAEVYSLPVAIWSTMLNVPFEETELTLLGILHTKMAANAHKLESDHEELLNDILSSTPRGATQPIAKLLTSAWTGDDDLMNIGIRKFDDKQMVFIAHKILVKQVNLGARWADKNIGDLLLMLPNAARSEQKIHKKKAHGIMVPYDLITPPDETESEDVPF